MVTEYPLACNNFANDEASIPFPNEEVTPPVTNIYLVPGKLNIFCYTEDAKLINNILRAGKNDSKITYVNVN